MELAFKYDIEKDMDNFFIVAKSPNPSKRQAAYERNYGTGLERDKLKEFIGSFIRFHGIDVAGEIARMKKAWDEISGQYVERAEKIFGIRLPCKAVTAYLTTSDRCGYSVKGNLFFISMGTSHPKRIIMHELWHFYFWHAFPLLPEKMGEDEYYDVKESLTEILNLEFSDLLDGEDVGYPQHKEMRRLVRREWLRHRDIKKTIEVVAKGRQKRVPIFAASK